MGGVCEAEVLPCGRGFMPMGGACADPGAFPRRASEQRLRNPGAACPVGAPPAYVAASGGCRSPFRTARLAGDGDLRQRGARLARGRRPAQREGPGPAGGPAGRSGSLLARSAGPPSPLSLPLPGSSCAALGRPPALSGLSAAPPCAVCGIGPEAMVQGSWLERRLGTRPSEPSGSYDRTWEGFPDEAGCQRSCP